MYFPSVHVENFFENPYKIIDFAKSLPLHEEENQRYPGVRTKALHEVNFDFFQFLCKRQLSVFYSKEEMNSVGYNCRAHFQFVNQEENAPFVHRDDAMLTTIVYLTPDEEQCGTSIVYPKDGTNVLSPNHSEIIKDATSFKMQTIKDSKAIDVKKAREVSSNFNDGFKEVTRFNSIFNSLSMFNSSSFHQAHFNSNGGERLTLICFFYDILAPRFPIPEMARARM